MDFDVIRKKFEINIRIKKRYYNKIINVEYEQATMYEILEFLFDSQKHGFNRNSWVVDFVANNCKQKLGGVERRIVSVKSNEIFESIQNTYFKGAFEKETKKEDEQDPSKNDLMSSYIVFLSSELKQDPLYLMKNYTIEQLKFFTDGITWNLNAKTTEGQKKNRLKLVAERSKNIDDDGTKNLLSKIDETRCSEVSK